MKCPMCQTENDFGTILCQCGYNFFTATVDHKKALRNTNDCANTFDLSQTVDDDGNWICPCGVTNKKEDVNCNGCGYSLRQTKVIMESRLGVADPRLNLTWQCKCGNENTILHDNCIACNGSQTEAIEAAVAKIDLARGNQLNWDGIIKYCVITSIWNYTVSCVWSFIYVTRSIAYFDKQLLAVNAVKSTITSMGLLNYLVLICIFIDLAKTEAKRTFEHAMFVVVGVKSFDIIMELLFNTGWYSWSSWKRNLWDHFGTWFLASITLKRWFFASLILASAATLGILIGRWIFRRADA